MTPIPITGLRKLSDTISDLIVTLDPTNAVSQEIRYQMSQSLENDVHTKILKFVAGQKEHGGDIRDRDLSFEIHCEMIDMFWYKEALFRWPKPPTKANENLKG